MTSHSFDCDCTACSASDTAALGMSIFRKTPAKVTAAATTTAPSTVKTEPTRRLPAGQRVGNGRVRSISERQEWFINKLIAERDLSDLKLITGQTLDPNEIAFMGLKGAKALIEKMLGCPYKGTNSPVMAAQTNFIPATDAQINYYVSLMGQKMKRGFSKADITSPLSKKDAMAMISQLKDMPYLPREVASLNEPKVATDSVTEGMYTVGTRIFKVQAAKQTGNLYAKELIEGKFEYVAGAISIVRREGIRMSIEEAKAYGKRTGQCCVCSRELTVKASIDAGIGPICASKF